MNNTTYEKLCDYTLEKINTYFSDVSNEELAAMCNIEDEVIDMLVSYPYCVAEELIFQINEFLYQEISAVYQMAIDNQDV